MYLKRIVRVFEGAGDGNCAGVLEEAVGEVQNAQRLNFWKELSDDTVL